MAENPQMLAQQIYFLKNPQAALKFQQQQALAQQMMQQGSEYPDSAKMVGNVVAPVSPFADAAKAAQMVSGAYLQKKNNESYGNALAQQMMQGQANPNGTASALGNALNPAAPVTGDSYNDAMQNAVNGEAYKAAVTNKYMGLNKAAEVAQTPQDFNGHKGFIVPPALGGKSAPQMSPTPQPSGNLSQIQATGSNILPNGQADNAASVFGDNQGHDIPSTAPQSQVPVDFNNPVAVAGAKAKAEKTGENIADAQKGVAGIDARLQGAMDILDNQLKLNDQKGHGAFGEYVGVPASRNIGSGKEASAQTQFEQNNANLFTQELPSIMSGMPGSRMDIPLINAIKDASQIPEYASHRETADAINNLRSQLQRYQRNTHQNFTAISGQPSPIPSINNAAQSTVPNPQDIVDELRKRNLVK